MNDGTQRIIANCRGRDEFLPKQSLETKGAIGRSWHVTCYRIKIQILKMEKVSKKCVCCLRHVVYEMSVKRKPAWSTRSP